LIKIRYSDLPAGLHVRVEKDRRGTIIWLLPGLSLDQRRAALLRVRRNASMGLWPRLPAGRLAAAIARDRMATTLRNGTSAFRAHPILLLPMAMLLSVTTAAMMSSAVTITVHDPQGESVPGLDVGQGSSRHQPLPQAYPDGAQAPAGSAPAPGRPGSGAPGRSRRPTRSPSPAPSPGRPAPGRSSPAPVTTSPAPDPGSPAPESSPPPSSPAPSPTTSGTCVRLGPLGICLHL
jgi:hypothetical protein